MSDGSVDWAVYAESYDLLLSHNPYYQSLHQEVLEVCRRWSPERGERLLDLGAGTGNYSIALAKMFDQCTISHAEPNEGMNGRARAKFSETGLDNLEVLVRRAKELELENDSLAGCVCVHAFYTFEEPAEMMKRIFRWLKPGAEAVLVDAGRKVNVLSWQLAIGWQYVLWLPRLAS
ncbi:MAG: class I SAM-dependent methyltransferase [Myxococcota bacterium]